MFQHFNCHFVPQILLDLIRQRCTRFQIDCDWRDGHLWTAVLPRRVKLLTDWQEEASQHWGYSGLQFIDKPQLRDWVDSDRQALLNGWDEIDRIRNEEGARIAIARISSISSRRSGNKISPPGWTSTSGSDW